MYKTKLQELCQRKSSKLPEYSVVKQGQDHNPSFEAVVSVDGIEFRSEATCKSSKRAQNEAAKLAFDFFSLPSPSPPKPQPQPQPEQPRYQALFPVLSSPQLEQRPCISQFPRPSLHVSSFPQPSLPLRLGTSGAGTNLDNKHSSPRTPQLKQEVANESFKIEDSIEGSFSKSHDIDIKSVQPKVQDADQSLVINDIDKECTKLTGMQHLYKNKLQSFAQKRGLTLPIYTCERDGPPHASRFRCKVKIDGRTYESPDFFATLKDAEHAAAKVALMSLCQDGSHEDNPGLYKNLLQEMTQKRGLGLPSYSTLQSGEVHVPVFVSTVKIGGETFEGQPSRTKKQAETAAAKVAYTTLKDRVSTESPLVVSPTGQPSKFVSCSVQSDVSTDLELQVRSCSPVISYPSMTIEKQHKDGGPESISTRKRGPSSCDPDFECTGDIPISHNVGQPGPPPDSNFVLNLISKLEAGKSNSKRIVVCPRQPNMKFPDDSTILPMSDDKWVAFSLSKKASN